MQMLECQGVAMWLLWCCYMVAIIFLDVLLVFTRALQCSWLLWVAAAVAKGFYSFLQ